MRGEFVSHSESETEALGRELARELRAGDIVALTGQLGAGKTAFTRGIARELGCTQPITSPTFSILNYYECALPLAHFDVYRIQPQELYNTGFFDYAGAECVSVIEWSDIISGCVNLPAVGVSIQVRDDGSRLISITDTTL